MELETGLFGMMLDMELSRRPALGCFIVINSKWVEATQSIHKAQLLNCMKLVGMKIEVLMNFKMTIRKVC